MIVENHATLHQAPWIAGVVRRFGMNPGFEHNTIFCQGIVAVVEIEAGMRTTVISISYFRIHRSKYAPSYNAIAALKVGKSISSCSPCPDIHTCDIMRISDYKNVTIIGICILNKAAIASHMISRIKTKTP